MNEVSSNSPWQLDVPQERPMKEGTFQKFISRLSDLHHELVVRHDLFARLIVIERGKGFFRVAFFDEGCGIPDKIVIFTDRKCTILDCLGGVECIKNDVDESVSRLINLIRLTAQNKELRRDDSVNEFFKSLQVRASRSSPTASVPCLSST